MSDAKPSSSSGAIVTKEDFDFLYKVFVQESLPELKPPAKDDPTWEYTEICKLKPYDKGIHVRVMVIKRMYVNHTKDGHDVHELRVADGTGCITLVLWDEIGQAAKPGDVLLINGGFVLMFQQTMRLGCKVGTVRRVGFCDLPVRYSPNYSKVFWRPDDQEGLIPDESSLPGASVNSDEERFYKEDTKREPPLHLCHSVKININKFY